MTDLKNKLAAALGDYYTDPATRVPEMPPMHWGGAKVVLDVLEAEGTVLVMKDPDSCPCGHEDNHHVHYCSADVAVGWCGCAAEYVREDR
jgi:hypothetical protein